MIARHGYAVDLLARAACSFQEWQLTPRHSQLHYAYLATSATMLDGACCAIRNTIQVFPGGTHDDL